MATVNDIFAYIDSIAPFATQMSFDNAGFLVGRGGQTVTTILVALDITEEIVAEAAERGAQLIVSHHPVIFHPAKSVTDADPMGRILLALLERGISAICAHTNLDAAQGGVNDALAAALGLTDLSILEEGGTGPDGAHYGIGRVGTLSGVHTAADYAARVKAALGASCVRYVDANRPVHRVAVGGGSCGDMLYRAADMGCDTFVTADVKHNLFLEARAVGINLMDAGHFATETVICPVLVQRLSKAFPAVQVVQSTRQREAFSTL